MIRHAFQEGIPEGFTPDFEAGIFHDQRHILLQSSNNWHSFSVTDPEQKKILAIIHYHVDGPLASSPFRSPYGSFIFSKSISLDQLKKFIEFTEQNLIGKGVRTFLLKNSPEVYAVENKTLQQALMEVGYEVHLEETSAVTHVYDKPFSEGINRSKRNLLKKAHDHPFMFKQVSLSQLKEVYSFLKLCYSDKGYQLSMSLEEVQRVTQVFPDCFFLFVATHREQPVAACISIQVSQTVLYTFYYNHVKEYDHISPVVFLCEGIYKFCQEAKIKLLDLGTSNTGTQVNEPLLNFKLSLGAQPSRKITFIKNID